MGARSPLQSLELDRNVIRGGRPPLTLMTINNQQASTRLTAAPTSLKSDLCLQWRSASLWGVCSVPMCRQLLLWTEIESSSGRVDVDMMKEKLPETHSLRGHGSYCCSGVSDSNEKQRKSLRRFVKLLLY